MWTTPRHSYSNTAAAAPLAVLGLLVVAAIVQQPLAISAAVFVLILYLTARVWSARMATGLAVSRSCPDHALVGKEIAVEVRVRNGSRLPVPWLRLSEFVPPALDGSGGGRSVITLRGRQEHVFEYTIRPRERGVQRVGPLSAELGDLLGVQSFEVTLPQSEPLIVWPRIVPLDRLGLPARSAIAVVPVTSSLYADTDRVVGVREYREGDSLRHVHWPASAQSDRTLVKQFQPAIGRPTLLCLDLDPYGSAAEQTIVVAASLAHHIVLREGQPVGLITQGVDPERPEEPIDLLPANTPPHLRQMLDCLARVRRRGDEGLPTLLRRAAARLPACASIILITCDPTEPAVHALVQARGHARSIVVVAPPGRARAQRSLWGIPVYRVWDDGDIGGL